MPSPLHGTTIDHVELIVPDRHAAAAWYENVLGLTIVPGTEDWARNSGGPLMISGDGGRVCLALFRRPASRLHHARRLSPRRVSRERRGVHCVRGTWSSTGTHSDGGARPHEDDLGLLPGSVWARSRGDDVGC